MLFGFVFIHASTLHLTHCSFTSSRFVMQKMLQCNRQIREKLFFLVSSSLCSLSLSCYFFFRFHCSHSVWRALKDWNVITLITSCVSTSISIMTIDLLKREKKVYTKWKSFSIDNFVAASGREKRRILQFAICHISMAPKCFDRLSKIIDLCPNKVDFMRSKWMTNTRIETKKDRNLILSFTGNRRARNSSLSHANNCLRLITKCLFLFFSIFLDNFEWIERTKKTFSFLLVLRRRVCRDSIFFFLFAFATFSFGIFPFASIAWMHPRHVQIITQFSEISVFL